MHGASQAEDSRGTRCAAGETFEMDTDHFAGGLKVS